MIGKDTRISSTLGQAFAALCLVGSLGIALATYRDRLVTLEKEHGEVRHEMSELSKEVRNLREAVIALTAKMSN